jgi:hypothetical protein
VATWVAGPDACGLEMEAHAGARGPSQEAQRARGPPGGLSLEALAAPT